MKTTERMWSMENLQPPAGWPGDFRREPTDAQLLRRYTHLGDENAFSQLVRRHGPMVLGVCRRLLRDTHSADDAFQATFLILVRRANEIKNPDLLGNWLYGVAGRVATRVRKQQSRFVAGQEFEERAGKDTTELALLDELEGILDEEIQRLPNHYRSALVLCCLEGKSYDEAGLALRCSIGTIKSRLARAREKLRRQLENRGWKVAVAWLAALLVPETLQAAPSSELLRATSNWGDTWLPDHRSPDMRRVERLADADTKRLAQWRLLPAGIAILGLLVVSVVFFLWLSACGGSKSGKSAQTAKVQVANPDKPPKFMKLVDCWPKVFKVDQPVQMAACSSDGIYVALACADNSVRVHASVTGNKMAHFAHQQNGRLALAVASDQKSLAVLNESEKCVRVFDFRAGAEKRPLQQTGEKMMPLRQPLVFSPDGRWLACGAGDRHVALWNVATRQSTLLPCPASIRAALAFAPDSKTLALADATGRVHLWNVKDETPQRQINAKAAKTRSIAYSTDGRLLAVCSAAEVTVWDASSGKRNHRISRPRLPRTSDKNDTPAGEFHSAMFAKNGRLLVADRRNIYVYNPESGKLAGSLKDYAARPNCLVGNLDGTIAASVADDDIVKVWCPVTAKILE